MTKEYTCFRGLRARNCWPTLPFSTYNPTTRPTAADSAGSNGPERTRARSLDSPIEPDVGVAAGTRSFENYFRRNFIATARCGGKFVGSRVWTIACSEEDPPATATTTKMGTTRTTRITIDEKRWTCHYGGFRRGRDLAKDSWSILPLTVVRRSADGRRGVFGVNPGSMFHASYSPAQA